MTGTAAAVTPERGVIAAYATAWQAGDLATMFASYADDILVHYGGTSPFAGAHHTRERFIEVLIETAARSSRRLVSIDQIDDHLTHGALFVTETMVVDHITVTLRRALRFRVAGARIAECWLYDLDQHVVDRAWSCSDAA
jgi:hypothetical protein